MGVDIHLHIINNEELIKESIYDGRCYEWFDNLEGNGDNPIYDVFPSYFGIPEVCPNKIKEDFDSKDYYGFHYVKVKDFIDWYNEKKPYLEAGWVTTYEKWLYDNKNEYPTEIKQCLFKDEEIDFRDYVFSQFVNKYEKSYWLFHYLSDNNISDDCTIIYYFDC